MIYQVLFWAVPSFNVSAIFVALQEFFLGPLLPAIIVASYLHVPTIGFAAAFGGGGGDVLPCTIGSLSQANGVRVLQPITLVL